MTQVIERQHEALSAAFETFQRDASFGPDWLARSRHAAFERFLERGFPSTRNEDWRFTNVAPIAATKFVRPAASTPARAAVEPYRFAGLPTVVVVNGRVSKALSSLESLPPEITFHTIENADPQESAVRSRAYTTGAPTPFVHLNGAFFEDVVTLHVRPKTVVSQAVHVLSIVTTDKEPLLVAPRLAIDVGEGAQLTVIESYASIGGAASLTTAVTDVELGPGAVVHHVKIQRESAAAFHLASTYVTLARSSTFTSQAITFGGRIARNDIVALLDGEGAECTLNGLYLADGDALVDTHTTIDHAKPHCPSHEVYKGILAGRARAVFNGKIIVRPDAQKTDAKQTNKALLLSDEATINTKPQLEIFADDVKCTHGAAIGQLDEDALFYLKARGIAEVDARSLLIHAFASQVLDGIAVAEVRDRVQQVMEDKLKIAHEERVSGLTSV